MIPEPYPVLWTGQRAVVVLPGHIDEANAAEVRSELLAVINRGATVMIIDMSATVSCDHAGAEAVARAYQRAVVNGTDLRLVVTSHAVRHEITVSGLDWQVPVYHCLEQALASRKPPERALTSVAKVPARARSRRPAGGLRGFHPAGHARGPGQARVPTSAPRSRCWTVTA